MTTYRLLNNVFKFKEAFVDFKAMRRNYNELKVGFVAKNTSLLENLKNEWIPINVKLDASSSSKKKAEAPDLSVWNMSCLVMSGKAKKVLEPLLKQHGEILPLNDGFYLFNCLESVDSKAVDGEQSSFEIEPVSNSSTELLGTPKKLVLLSSAIKGKEIFKPGFSQNSFLICQNKFKTLVEEASLGGLIFEENLAQMFPTKK